MFLFIYLFFKQIIIRNMETHCVSVFKSNQWFSKTGDGKLVQEIPAEVDGEEVLTGKLISKRQNTRCLRIRWKNIHGDCYVIPRVVWASQIIVINPKNKLYSDTAHKEF